MKPALIIIDMQKAFYKDDCKISMKNASPVINEAISSFKAQNSPIVWVQDINEEKGVFPGASGFEIIDALNCNNIEHSIHKQSQDCFTNTNCADLLKELDVDIAVIAGFCADYCVLSSYKGAIKKGFTAVILKQGIAAGSEEDINKVVIKNDTISMSLLKKIIESC